MKQDFTLIPSVLDKDPEYPEGIQYPFYTHKHSHGNSTGLVWICEDCGYTADFSYRNDLICASAPFYCKRCKCSQMLNLYYNGEYKQRKCCECNKEDELVEWAGDICPKCGGKIRQFNAAHIKKEYINYNYYFADKNVTIFDTIKKKESEKTEGINQFIASYVQNEYHIDVKTATQEQLKIVEKILVGNKTMSHDYGVWDFSVFPNLKKIDVSYNPIDKLNVSKNLYLEEIHWEGARGRIDPDLDLSNNIHLKKIFGGQDGIIQLDLSHNHELEILTLNLNSSMRWIDLSGCTNLQIINLIGINIPFVDLTNCKKLQRVDINYFNLYRSKCDTFGPGFPRPIVFVCEDFDESIIDENTRNIKNYTYYLIKVKSNSPEEQFLNELKNMKEELISIPNDGGSSVAKAHYALLELLNKIQHT